MKEIPIPYVRSNQVGIVLFVLLAILLQQPILIIILWALQVIPMVLGLRANLFINIAKPFLTNKIQGAQTESQELLRFNNSIAVVLLSIAVICFCFSWSSIAGYLFAAMVGIAASIAICGFCIGCFLYYQWKSRTR
ncbi:MULTISPECIES: DUF4395 domain-containing protein [Paenibacillus]|uniref:DUF4395 domain-containing protein n=1 Tax=Paenibacillus baimaensis TaxID=2982185 RepID=A0ABT2UTL3_9BACL|nr:MULTISPECIES: DUF4395 domain-containing protein [unclassified Paenibacillus]MCU6797902.1 DUF4395 domain-containing protein [Paenibacillus sp. WQ 127069]OMF19976.1 hypothetical protein BK127_03535 [Paenibacillus sp. FSL H7-0331]